MILKEVAIAIGKREHMCKHIKVKSTGFSHYLEISK